ncbi:MAG TPA: trigger factor [Acidobacteriota bacterium]|nr:trigger factor [Acidobacteriota bacterium]
MTASMDHEAEHSHEGVHHTLRLVVPAETMRQQLDTAAQAFREHARLAGFRRGKAPLSMVAQQFGDQIRQRVLDNAIPELVRAELEARELQPLDSPTLGEVEFRAGEPLTFTVSFDTAPEVTIVDLDLSATRPHLELTDEMIDEALGNLRERAASLAPAPEGEGISAGTYARCEIALFAKDGKGRKLLEENRYVHVGQEGAIPGLNTQLEGLTVGQERTFVTELADTYPNALLAGKEVRCRVQVAEIKSRQLPAIDEDFAKDLGMDDLAALRAKIAEDLKQSLEAKAEREVEQQLLDQLRKKNPVEVPASLIERRLDEMSQRFASDLARQGVDPREAINWAEFRAENRERASDGIADEMLLDRIADDEQLVVDDEQVTAEIRSQLEQSEGGNERPLPSVVQQMRKEGAFEGLRITMRRRFALDHLQDRATITQDGGENASVSGAQGVVGTG